MKDGYMQCYLSGRGDAYDGDIDIEKLAERSVSPGAVTIREISLGAAKKAIDSEMDAATKVQWLKDNLEEIKVMGGDTEKAWRCFVQGRVDNLAHQLEADIVVTLEEDEEDEDEHENDGDDEEEDDDSEEDDEDEDEP